MKITKTQLKKIIKEELSMISEDIDSDEYYSISGEDIIELRKLANEISMKDPTKAKYMYTLLSPPNIRGPLK